MIIRPKIFDYQRNGISGIPFYTLVFDWEELDKSRPEGGDNFWATFETDENDLTVKNESCRVVDPDHPLTHWRGDLFGEEINETLKQLRIKYSHDTIGDLKVLINGDKF